MNVQHVMTSHPGTCAPTDSLASAARLMSAGDYGFLPVVEPGGRLVGVLTDRDICLAIGRHGHDPQRALVSDVMNRAVHTCRDDADLPVVLATMKRERVRRLPVVDAAGRLKGVVSLDDVVLASDEKGSMLTRDAVVDAFRAICEHRLALAASSVPRSFA